MRYLSYRKIPATLRRRVRAYFALKWQRTRGFVEKGVIDELPRSIGMDVRRSSTPIFLPRPATAFDLPSSERT